MLENMSLTFIGRWLNRPMKNREITNGEKRTNDRRIMYNWELWFTAHNQASPSKVDDPWMSSRYGVTDNGRQLRITAFCILRWICGEHYAPLTYVPSFLTAETRLENRIGLHGTRFHYDRLYVPQEKVCARLLLAGLGTPGTNRR